MTAKRNKIKNYGNSACSIYLFFDISVGRFPLIFVFRIKRVCRQLEERDRIINYDIVWEALLRVSPAQNILCESLERADNEATLLMYE